MAKPVSNQGFERIYALMESSAIYTYIRMYTVLVAQYRLLKLTLPSPTLPLKILNEACYTFLAKLTQICVYAWCSSNLKP